MHVFKIFLLTIAALLCLAPAATPSSLKRIRRGSGDCLDESTHTMFETFQNACFKEVAVEKTKELGEGNYDAAEIDKQFGALLDYYAGQPGHFSLGDSLRTKFEACFTREATKALSMTMDAIEQKLKTVSVVRMLEKANNPKCKVKYAEVDVLDKQFIKEKQEQWQKLGIFRRAIKTAMGKFVAFTNKAYVECLEGIDKVTLPQLLCAAQGKDGPLILEKKHCYEELLETAAARTKTAADSPPRTLLRLGIVGKYVTDNFICTNIDKQHNVKQNLKGALKLFGVWPLATLASIIAIPVGAIVFFFYWCHADCFVNRNPTFLCAGGIGAIVGAVLGLCLLLYSVFDIPWKAFTRIFSYDDNSNKLHGAFEDFEWIRKQYAKWINI